MRKYVYILLIVLVVIIIFTPFLRSSTVLQTSEQKKIQEQFCASHGCGALFKLSPYQWLKESSNNLFFK